MNSSTDRASARAARGPFLSKTGPRNGSRGNASAVGPGSPISPARHREHFEEEEEEDPDPDPEGWSPPPRIGSDSNA